MKMNPYIPVQDYHSLEFHKITEEQNHDSYALEKIRDILMAEMNPQLSRGIIFLNNRRKCEEYAEELEQEFTKLGRDDFGVGFYHAGMAAEDRSLTEADFRNGEIVVIFATKAFGMGVDIPNIHFVFHQRPPSNLENYLQEIGRAGRDATSRQEAGMEKVRCVLFYSADSFAQAKTTMQKHRLHWSDIESMRVAIAQYRQQQANPNDFIIPVDLIKESNDLKEKKNPQNTQRMLLHWLEELGKIKLGDRVVSHLNLSLGASSNLSSPLAKLVQQKGGTREKSVSILISQIQETLHLNSTSQVLTALFQAHKRGEIRFQRNLRIKMTKFGIEEAENKSYKLYYLAHIELKKLSLHWQDKQEISAKNLSFTSQGDRLGKSWPKMVRLLNRLNGIRLKSKSGGVHEISIRGKNSESWRYELEAIQELCPKILSAIQEKHEQQETINLGDLMALSTIENSDLLKAALSWLRDLGYIRYEQDFIPTSLELHINDEQFISPIVDPSIRGLDRAVQQKFENYHLLNEWRLNALVALTEITDFAQQTSFIQEYFACQNVEEIEDLILNKLPDNSLLGSQLRLEAFDQKINQLNPEQKQMVEACVKKSLIVAAGPGTGKTRTLLLCVANLIVQHRENPDDILVLAYNAAVVAELRSGINRLLRDLGYASSYNSLHIYTFHAYVRRSLGDRLPKKCELEKYPGEYLNITATNKSLLRPNGREAPHYIFIDEYQDINYERYQMLRRRIKGDNTHLIAIGDDDQSIYGYERKNNGESMSSAPYFKRFETDFQAQWHNLTINYRSGTEILDKAERYIRRNSDRLRQAPLKAGRQNSVGEFIISKLNQENFLEQIIDITDNILNQHTFSSFSIAILFRTNAELYRILGAFQQKFQRQAQIRVQGGKERFAALRQIAVVLDLLEKESERLIASFKGDFLKYICKLAHDFYLNRSNRTWNGNCYYLLEAAAWYFEKNASRNSTVAEFIEYIQYMHDISELLFLYKQYQASDSRSEGSKQLKPNIILSTIHKIKGLEFDAVVIPAADCNQNIIGKEAIEEERRLRYVGMSRARDYLHLIVGSREEKLYIGENIRELENPKNGLKFDSGYGYETNNDEGGKGMFTLFKFAQDEYAKHYSNQELTLGTSKGLQNLILWKIGEGDELKLHWHQSGFYSHYHLYYPKLATNIGRVTLKNSEYIRNWFQNKGLPSDSLAGIRVTSISRFQIPEPGEEGAEYNKYLCEFVKQQGYYYIVDCAGYLLPPSKPSI
jgi:ATP-dependent DNA helicase RecQ